MESNWNELLHWWPYSERLLFCFGTFFLHEVMFWGESLVYMFLHRYSLFEKYLIRPKQYYPPPELVLSATKQLLFSHFVTQVIALYFFYDVFVYCGIVGPDAPAFPSFAKIAVDVFLSLLINDFLFFVGHRLLHTSALYATFHKKHHEFHDSIGLASEYAHPVEVLLGNQLPALAGPMLLQSHLFTFWVYLIFRVHQTVQTHSGYDFPWAIFNIFPWQGGARAHDFHHSHNQGMYGSGFSCIWDSLCGTDVHYRKYLKEHKFRLKKDWLVY